MHHILVIDDQKPVLDVVRLALARSGYTVEIAGNGQQGIQKFDEGRFDLVITDILMPGVDGHNVVRHIRQSKRPSIPIIGFSGTPWALDASDFDVVFAKPFPLKDLVEAVDNLSANASTPHHPANTT